MPVALHGVVWRKTGTEHPATAASHARSPSTVGVLNVVRGGPGLVHGRHTMRIGHRSPPAAHRTARVWVADLAAAFILARSLVAERPVVSVKCVLAVSLRPRLLGTQTRRNTTQKEGPWRLSALRWDLPLLRRVLFVCFLCVFISRVLFACLIVSSLPFDVQASLLEFTAIDLNKSMTVGKDEVALFVESHAQLWVRCYGCVAMGALPWMRCHGCVAMGAQPWVRSHGCVVPLPSPRMWHATVPAHGSITRAQTRTQCRSHRLCGSATLTK